MLWLDALENGAPTIWLVLTTRSTDPEPRSFYRSREQLFKALRRRWPDVESACLLEFTTGYGSRSGGKRRPHFNVMLKNLPSTAVDDVRAVVNAVWCAREDARPSGQSVKAVSDAGGLTRYLALHFQKESQRPPEGWRGHRFVKSRGYFPNGAADARERARRSLVEKRAVWKAIQAGHQGEAAEAVAAAALAISDATSWRLRFLSLDELVSYSDRVSDATSDRPPADVEWGDNGSRT